MDPQDRPDHDTKGTLRADEQLMQRWAGGGSGTWPRRRKRAVGQHHGESKHHVLDASVATRLLARGSRGDQPPDRGAGQGARVVSERQSSRVELLLERVAVDPRLAAARQIRFIDLQHPVERAHVEHELAGGGRQGAADAASTAHRRHRHPLRGGPTQNRRELLTTRRPRDQHPRRRLAVPDFHHREWPQVPHRALVDRGGPDQLLELRPHCFAA